MRYSAVLVLMISLAACNRGVPNNDAVRQGVLEHLTDSQSKMPLNLAAMDVVVKSVQFNGSEADAAVEINAKGTPPGGGMSINYHLKQQGSKWVVVGRQDSHGALAPGGPNPHGGAMPDAPNPHGDASMASPGGAGGRMPSPDDLPPTGKKK